MAVPVPSKIMYLQARVQICFGPVKSFSRPIPKLRDSFEYEYYPRLSIDKIDSKCCNRERGSYFNYWSKGEAQSCSTCPEGSKPRLHGYYCEHCSAGMEPSDEPLGCVPCKPGFAKEAAGMHNCQACEVTAEKSYGKTHC